MSWCFLFLASECAEGESWLGDVQPRANGSGCCWASAQHNKKIISAEEQKKYQRVMYQVSIVIRSRNDDIRRALCVRWRKRGKHMNLTET